MARKAKDNPTNLTETDIADSLRLASSQLVEAQDALEAAREPVRGAKAVVKAAGIDFDIFKLCHGIRHLDDDDARQKRIRKLQVAIAALLSDKVQLDLFGFMTAQVKPAVREALQQASDTLQREAPEEAKEHQDQEIPFDVEPPSVPEPEAVEEDIPALMSAEEMPENAGFIANNGLSAGRLGHGPEMNPHPENSVEARLWEQGRARGAEMGPEADQQDVQDSDEQPAGADVTDLATAKRGKVTDADKLAAYFAGFDAASQDKFGEDCPHGRGTLKTQWVLGLKDAQGGKPARFVRPAAAQVEQQDDAVSEDAPADGDDQHHDDEPAGRVEVWEIDGKYTLYDLETNSPLMDVSGPKTGETWANQINTFFADRLETVTRDELIDAAKTLARGRLLTAPTTALSYDVRSAV
ncbi:hypothetical protein CRT60_21915 [Azospirillum palustre]|uniref:Uncharacterized protein n=1 Tax=Azospirillum palustre TaxID=2044885 RepID=A0A2B8BDW6_9PROT|nr:hypothetical protein [Azospirillum palustre]PGH55909.1 hypothetical protein CRT60_21915 [Azospirillum palustre]